MTKCPSCGSTNTERKTWRYNGMARRVFICHGCGLNKPSSEVIYG